MADVFNGCHGPWCRHFPVTIVERNSSVIPCKIVTDRIPSQIDRHKLPGLPTGFIFWTPGISPWMSLAMPYQATFQFRLP